MSDSLEPPAKRARLEMDAPIGGASATALDAPGSPVDDMDDDFYDTTPVKPAAPAAAVDGAPSASVVAAPAPASFHLPGLGAASDPPGPQPLAQALADGHGDAASEDGELSDGDTFYNDESEEKALGSAAANQAHAPAGAPPHDAVETPDPAHDSDDDLDAALAAAIDQQNEADESAQDTAVPPANAIDGDDGKAQFLLAAEANKNNRDAEWQLDSDASDSDSDSDSSSSSGDSSDEGSDEGELLDPEEQIRLLMAEVADEPGTTGKVKVKTVNEVDEQYEKPDITVTADTKITELGIVESVVDNILVIKPKTRGEDQVLESGSALCLQNRTVIGKVSEQIGRVEDPRYSVGFNDPAEIETLGIAKDTPIFYVNEHTTFVLTQPLRAQKHTDASNLHDEEMNEVEFSDDEKELAYKQEQKAKKRARHEVNDEDAPPSLPIPTGPRNPGYVHAPVYRPTEYQGGGLKYSDDEDEDLGMYKPLARPDHFEQIVGHGAPLEDRSHVRRGMMRGRGGWGGDRGRGFRGRGGRGDFGGGRGDRGGYGGGRGDFGGGRGDHGNVGNRGDRAGSNNNRGDKGGNDKGGRFKGDRGRNQEQFHDRQQDKRQKTGSQRDGRSATSASPARQQQERGPSQTHQDRGHSHPQQTQQPPARANKNKNRKQRNREKREREFEERRQQQQQQQKQQQQPPKAPTAPAAMSGSSAYTAPSGGSWPASYSGAPQPVAHYPQAAAPAPPPGAATYQYPNAAAPVPQPGAPSQQQHEESQRQWAQWLTSYYIQQAQAQAQAQAPAPAPIPQPAAPQQQPQYAYQSAYQYAQPAAAPAQPQQAPSAQDAAALNALLQALSQQAQAPRGP